MYKIRVFVTWPCSGIQYVENILEAMDVADEISKRKDCLVEVSDENDSLLYVVEPVDELRARWRRESRENEIATFNAPLRWDTAHARP